MNRTLVILAGFLLISAGVLTGVYQTMFEKDALSRESILEKILQGEEYLQQSNESSREKAISIFSELSAKSSQEFQFRIRYNLGRSLEKNGDSYRALEIYQSLIGYKNLSPNEEEKLGLSMGNLFLRLDRESEGKAHLDEVLRRSTDRKNRSIVFYSLGSYYFFKKDWEDARKNYALAIQEDPNFTDARIGLGRSLKKLGKDYAAFDLFDGYLEESSRIDGTNPKIEKEYKSDVHSQAKQYFVNKNYWKAIEYYQKTIQLKISDSIEESALYHIASSYEALSKNTEAIQYYNKVLANSDYSLDQESIFKKGTIYFRQGLYDRAASVFHIAIEKYPKNHISEKAIAWKKESLDQLRDKMDIQPSKESDAKKSREKLEDDILDLDF